MIDEIRALARPLFRPQTQCFAVSDLLGIDGMLDLETGSAVLHVGNDGGYLPQRPATENELQSILEALRSNPPHPAELSPLEILSRFTPAEQDAIETSAPQFSRMLFSATSPVSWTRFAEAVSDLQQGLLLTSEQAARILGPQSGA